MTMANERRAPILAVFVPNECNDRGRLFAAQVARGSGIVGRLTLTTAGLQEVCYEGNLYGAANIVTYADRIYQAAARLVSRYPTMARVTLPPSAIYLVGTFDYGLRQLVVTDQTPLAGWLGASNGRVPPGELQISRF
jgi:hypothetical protein